MADIIPFRPKEAGAEKSRLDLQKIAKPLNLSQLSFSDNPLVQMFTRRVERKTSERAIQFRFLSEKRIPKIEGIYGIAAAAEAVEKIGEAVEHVHRLPISHEIKESFISKFDFENETKWELGRIIQKASEMHGIISRIPAEEHMRHKLMVLASIRSCLEHAVLLAENGEDEIYMRLELATRIGGFNGVLLNYNPKLPPVFVTGLERRGNYLTIGGTPLELLLSIVEKVPSFLIPAMLFNSIIYKEWQHLINALGDYRPVSERVASVEFSEVFERARKEVARSFMKQGVLTADVLKAINQIWVMEMALETMLKKKRSQISADEVITTYKSDYSGFGQGLKKELEKIVGPIN
ncbi:Uncharacterised protein [Candidatus Gugararchaeum adminiculabundum]|nr:Uncharacterised protein [Candidatus Gugararchaeum adminiculabundum]